MQAQFPRQCGYCRPLKVFFHPGLMRPMVTTKLGWCAIGTVIALEVIGYFSINKIVTVEV